MTARVRCAVLLDSRRAPSGSPPLAGVLLALQQQQQEQRDNSSGCEVACLGLLDLGGSCFLVNREMLLQRLKDFYCVESTTTTAGKMEHCGRAQSCTTKCSSSPSSSSSSSGRCGVTRASTEGQPVGVTTVGPSSQQWEGYPASPAGNSSAAAQQQGLRRDFALVDVRKSLASPCDRSDFLVAKLHASLRSAFGDVPVATVGSVRGDHTNLSTADLPSPPQPDGIPPSHRQGSPTTAEGMAKNTGEDDRSSSSGNRSSSDFCLAPNRKEGEGARWLRDWGMKEMSLDCESLRDTLGDVGLPGLAGWLLEYPVIYCCPPSLVRRRTDDEDRGGGGDDGAEHATGNCLAAVPLTVYSLSVEIDDKDDAATRCCSPRVPLDSTPSSGSAGTTSSQAFSFSVPEIMCGATEPEKGREERRNTAGVHRLVDFFFERLESRIARHRRRSSSSSGDGGRHQQLVRGLTVTKRNETLDRVAL